MKLASTSPRAFALFAAAGMLVTAAACTVTTGDIDDDDPANPTPRVDGGSEGGASEAGSSDASGGSCTLAVSFTNLSAACNTCLQTNCCAPINGCFAETVADGGVGCGDYEECIQTCVASSSGDSEVQECVTTICDEAAKSNPAAKAGSTAWRSCNTTSCQNECGAL